MFIDRATWGARPPKHAPTAMTAFGVTDTFVHHGASPATVTTQASIDTVRSYQNFHMDSRGWNDIAYSFLVDDLGNVFEGRGWFIVGAHTLGHNDTSHAVCWIGNTEQPSEAALASINQLISEAASRCGRALRVQPHSAVYQTTCPGDILRAWLAAGRPVSGAPAAPAPAPTPAPSNVVQIGSVGPAVRHVQERLEAHSINDARLNVAIDGQFGPATQAAVRVFQADTGNTVDGVVGSNTLASLDSVPNRPAAPAPAPAPMYPTISRGASGAAVVYLQKRLATFNYNLKADGLFGPFTDTCVRNFQRNHGLVSDGIVGPNTWKVLG